MKQKQLLTNEDAVEVKRQHKKPCSDCPWSRASVPGWLGPYDADRWLELAHGDSCIPCHTRKDAETGEFFQCAGAAMFRDNVFKSPRDRRALDLKGDKELVFANNAEFLEHHEGKKPFGR